MLLPLKVLICKLMHPSTTQAQAADEGEGAQGLKQECTYGLWLAVLMSSSIAGGEWAGKFSNPMGAAGKGEQWAGGLL